MELDEEIKLLAEGLGKRKAKLIQSMLMKLDNVPHNTCAMAMYPKILYDKSLMKHDLKKRVFIIAHEYMHLEGNHGTLIKALIDDPLFRTLKVKDREALAVWAVEIWVNVKVYMMLGYRPNDLELFEEDIRLVSLMKSVEIKKFCRLKMRRWMGNWRSIKRIGRLVHSCYC